LCSLVGTGRPALDIFGSIAPFGNSSMLKLRSKRWSKHVFLSCTPS
jgi:hypothetical protein